MSSPQEKSSFARLAAMAVVVLAGCYLGARAGVWLRFPGLGAAILFPPYAIVTAALLWSQPRTWWLVVLAAAAGNILGHHATKFAMCAELLNQSRALLAAIGIRIFVGRTFRLEGMREMVAYLIVAVFVAPAAGALGGAGLVAWLKPSSPGFWITWQQWWLSNAITGLTLLPLLTAAPAEIARVARRRPQRIAEIALLVLGLVAVTVEEFAHTHGAAPSHPEHLYWALPFLLWAAVRFGPRGTSAVLLVVSSVMIWGAIKGRGPFAPQSPAENLLELQVFLLAVSIPVLLLAAQIKQQARTAAALTELEARKSAEAALVESNRRKDDFLAMLGHELRNPLAPISIALQILVEAPPDSRDAAWARESIGRQLRHMTRLLDDLLDISRVTLGKIQLQLGPVNVGHVVASAVEATRPLIESGAHQLSIGIAADALERIFDLFSQLPGGHERAQGGLGVGLTLARRLVELHGGTVEAHSEGAGRGAEIIVRLPAPPPAAATDTPVEPAAPPEHSAASLRILAVDDNVHMAQGLASILRMWGHTVRTAHDGAAALEVATQFAPEVVLLDLSLPRVDGLEVARRLRQTPERAPTLLVSMSGFGQEDTRRHSDEAGFHHHLIKPFDMNALRLLLDDCIRAKTHLSA